MCVWGGCCSKYDPLHPVSVVDCCTLTSDRTLTQEGETGAGFLRGSAHSDSAECAGPSVGWGSLGHVSSTEDVECDSGGCEGGRAPDPASAGL